MVGIASAILGLCMVTALAEDTEVQVQTRPSTSAVLIGTQTSTTTTVIPTSAQLTRTRTSTTTTQNSTAAAPLGQCAKAVVTFEAIAAEACTAQGEVCPEQCSTIWRSLLDGCVGQNFRNGSIAGLAVTFDAPSYVQYAAVLFRHASGPCSQAPLAELLRHPKFTLDCSGSLTLLTMARSACREHVNKTTCSETCREVVETPFLHCSPRQEVPVAVDAGAPTTPAAALALQLGHGLSASCQGIFSGVSVQWLIDAGESSCDVKLATLTLDIETGAVSGCGAKGDTCNPACSGTFGSLFDACVGHDVFLLWGKSQDFDLAGFASFVVGSGTVLPDACLEVPLLEAWSHKSEQFSCRDAVIVFGASSTVCGGDEETICPSSCKTLNNEPLQFCEPMEELHPELDARTLFRQKAEQFSPACVAAWTPQYQKWLQPPTTTEAASGGLATSTGTEAATPAPTPGVRRLRGDAPRGKAP